MEERINSGSAYRHVLWVVLALALGLLLIPAAGPARAAARTYMNPVSKGVVDTFADPTIIRANDGYWYAYGTTDAVLESKGDNSLHYIPMLRSKDMVHWKYVGDAFKKSDLPGWFPHKGTYLWAPDIRYLNGKYYLYYSVAHPGSKDFTGPDSLFTVGVATAPTPTGPWKDSGGAVIPKNACDSVTNIDPAEFTDHDGTHYLYWGSFRHTCAAKLTPNAKRVTGRITTVSSGPVEGTYTVRHGSYYYLFRSESSCCNGAYSGYEVKVGRSKNPLGPFVDREGVPLTASKTKGSYVLAANGNKWVGPGHNAVATDLSGQDWFVYHALDRRNPYLNNGAPRRPLMIDRLDWIRGWPTVRAGRWASEDRERAPVTSWTVGNDFNGKNPLAGWRREGAARGGWKIAHERDAGGYVHQKSPAHKESYLVSKRYGPANLRAEANLRLPSGSRGAVGLVADYRSPKDHVTAWLDKKSKSLVVEARSVRKEAPLPQDFRFHAWHNVAVEIRGREMTAEVTDARLNDPLASAKITLPKGTGGRGAVGVVSRDARASADNVGAAPLYTPVKKAAPLPKPGTLDPAYSDEFNGGGDPAASDPAWSWIRPTSPPAATENGGFLRFPTQDAELYKGDNTASVLLREAPKGSYTVETKLTFNGSRASQQAGLIAYDGDNSYVKLVHAAADGSLGETQQTEFAKEGAPDDNYGNSFIGPPARTMWLRLYHRVDQQNGEHEFRAATSRDGRHWVWGGVWTMPAGKNPRIGLISMNKSGAVARFDYLRTYHQ